MSVTTIRHGSSCRAVVGGDVAGGVVGRRLRVEADDVCGLKTAVQLPATLTRRQAPQSEFRGLEVAEPNRPAAPSCSWLGTRSESFSPTQNAVSADLGSGFRESSWFGLPNRHRRSGVWVLRYMTRPGRGDLDVRWRVVRAVGCGRVGPDGPLLGGLPRAGVVGRKPGVRTCPRSRRPCPGRRRPGCSVGTWTARPLRVPSTAPGTHLLWASLSPGERGVPAARLLLLFLPGPSQHGGGCS